MKEPGAPRRIAVRVAAASIACLAIVLATHPWWLASVVGRSLSASAKREIRFDSIRVDLDAAFEPVVHMIGIRVANAAWADTRAPMATAAEVTAIWSWKSLTDERVVISKLVLRDAQVDLQRRVDGVRNWRLRDPESRGPGRYKILALEAHASTLRFVNRAIDLEVRMRAVPNAEAGLPTRIDFDGLLRKVAFTGSAVTGGTISFLETGQRFPLRGHAESDDVRLEVDGQVADLFHGTTLDVDTRLVGHSMAPFAAFFPPRWQGQRDWRLSAHLKKEGEVWDASTLRGRVGQTDVSGEGRYSLEPARTLLRASLRSDAADAADLVWLFGERAASGAASGAATSAMPSAVPSAERRAVSGAASGSSPHGEASPADQKTAGRAPIDLDVSYVARRFKVARVAAIQSLSVRATMRGEKVEVPAFDVGLAGGHATGRLSLDRDAAPHAVEGRLDWRGVRLQSLWPAPGRSQGTAPGSARGLEQAPDATRITGSLQGEATWRARGQTFEALRETVAGSASMQLVGGTIPSLLDAKIGLQVGKMVRSFVGGSEPVPLRCAALVLDAEAGKARVRSLVIDTERTRTTGIGSIDLRAGLLDAVLTSEAKGPALFVLDRSIRLHGPIAKPERSLVDRVAPTAASCRS